MEALERLRSWWQATGTAHDPHPRSDVQVRALERRYDVSLPEDFRSYLLTICPAHEAGDVEFTNWWPIHRIRNIPEEYEHEIRNPWITAKTDKYLFFADWSIWCCAWAIACTEDEDRGRVAVIGDTDKFVATSFTDFIDRYLTDFNSVC